MVDRVGRAPYPDHTDRLPRSPSIRLTEHPEPVHQLPLRPAPNTGHEPALASQPARRARGGQVVDAGLGDDGDGPDGGAVVSLLGTGPDDDPSGVYDLASPAELVPIGVPTLVVTGEDDGVVPPSQSTGYAELADAAGDDVTLEVVAGDNHFAHLDPSSRAWALTRIWLTQHLA